MAVTIDMGDPDNVHPSDKQTVAIRLALAARALAYHENIGYSGPLFRGTSTEEGAIRVWFHHTDGGLVAKGDTPQGFEIAGDDHHFVPATARIDQLSIVLASPAVKTPKYVRYGWRNAPTANLFNSAGLPASPFTSE
jgi:sialate O-acetylesterase